MPLITRNGFLTLTIKDSGLVTYINADSIETLTPVEGGTMLILLSEKVRVVKEDLKVIISMLRALGWYFKE